MAFDSGQASTGRTGGVGSQALGLAAVLVVFAVGFQLSRYVQVSIGPPPTPPAASDGYLPRAAIESGPQYMMIFAGSHTCHASSHEALPEAVESLKLELARLASEHGATFKAIGLSRPVPRGGRREGPGWGRPMPL